MKAKEEITMSLLEFEDLEGPISVSGSYIINGISGIWNSLGCPVNEGEGLSIYVESSDRGDASLADLVGFDQSKKHIGLLKSNKIVSELVVMLPMLQRDIDYIQEPPADPIYVPPPDPCAPCDEKGDPCPDLTLSHTLGEFYLPPGSDPITGLTNTAESFWSNDWSMGSGGVTSTVSVPRMKLQYCRTEDAWLFLINETIINKILNTVDYKKIKIQDIKNILETSNTLNGNNNIVKLMKAMVKYNFPPHLNWLLFPERVPPYAMYVAEFSTTLDKGDLSNIWQGSMPRAAKEPEEEEIIIEHFLADEEIFAGYDIANIENIKLSIFKCKMRAANNYYELSKRKQYTNEQFANLQDPERSKWYQYNWPYDNFSLVELLKIEGGEARDFIKPEEIAETVIITTSVNDGTTEVQTQTSKKDYNEYVASNASYTPSLYK